MSSLFNTITESTPTLLSDTRFPNAKRKGNLFILLYFTDNCSKFDFRLTFKQTIN